MTKVWYKEHYVWLIILFPLLAVIGSVITIILALASDDGLVADDYYKKGLQINRELQRDRRALELGLSADIQLNDRKQTIKITLYARNAEKLPKTINVRFLHATRAGNDQMLRLEAIDHNIYSAAMPKLTPGYWHVQIEADDWRLVKSLVRH